MSSSTSLTELKAIRLKLKAEGKKIVFTIGLDQDLYNDWFCNCSIIYSSNAAAVIDEREVNTRKPESGSQFFY